jgi:hypothetical protein
VPKWSLLDFERMGNVGSRSLLPIPHLTLPCLARLKNSKNSRFNNDQDLDALTECFDNGLKTTFSDNGKSQHVKFGSPRDTDPRCDVKNGKFSVTG